MALYSNGQHRTALGCTSFDSAGVHCARHCTSDWNTLHYTSVGGTGLDWTGLDWTGQHFTELDCCSSLLWNWSVPDGNTLHWTCVDGTSLEWAKLDWSERDKTALDQRALHIAALSCYRLCLTSLDCITLHCLGLNWKSTYSIVCIELDWTWKDYSGLPKLQWS